MSQGILADRGYRTVEAGSSSSGESMAARAARRSSPGEWTDDLGAWGDHEFVLPGQGDRGAGCNEYFPGSVCSGCGHIDMMSRNCGKRTCPDCWGRWAEQAALRAAARIQAFRTMQPDDHRRQVVHAIVSPPEGDVMNARQYWDGKKKAMEIAKEKGIRGAAVIPHPFRLTDEGKRRYAAENPDVGKWVWLRNDVEEWETFVKWSPHYHVVGLASEDMEPADESDDWVYHFRRSLKSYSGPCDRASHDDVYGLFRYLLSHTGFPEESTRQTTTWYGVVANNVFVEDATEDWQHEKPPERVQDRIRRELEAVVGSTIEDDDRADSAPREDDREECPCEDCGGELIDVFDISAYLRQRDPPPGVRDRMVVARDWRMGRIEPPPGLKRPRSEEQAREALGELL